MGIGDSPRSGRMRNRLGRIMERRRLRPQRKLESSARPPDSDPSGAWQRQRGTGPSPRAERQALAVGERADDHRVIQRD